MSGLDAPQAAHVQELVGADVAAARSMAARQGGRRVTAIPQEARDGDVIEYVADATDGIVWRFRYRQASAHAYKWERVGGGFLSKTVSAAEGKTGGSYGNLATVGPTVTVPLPGEYVVLLGSDVGVNNTTNTYGAMSFDIGATPAVDADALKGNTFHSSSFMRRLVKTFAAAGTALVAKYKSFDGVTTVTWTHRMIAIRPVRVG